eukprot:PhM_4_TR4179/c0_g1_i1/m.78533
MVLRRRRSCCCCTRRRRRVVVVVVPVSHHAEVRRLHEIKQCREQRQESQHARLRGDARRHDRRGDQRRNAVAGEAPLVPRNVVRDRGAGEGRVRRDEQDEHVETDGEHDAVVERRRDDDEHAEEQQLQVVRLHGGHRQRRHEEREGDDLALRARREALGDVRGGPLRLAGDHEPDEGGDEHEHVAAADVARLLRRVRLHEVRHCGDEQPERDDVAEAAVAQVARGAEDHHAVHGDDVHNLRGGRQTVRSVLNGPREVGAEEGHEQEDEHDLGLTAVEHLRRRCLQTAPAGREVTPRHQHELNNKETSNADPGQVDTGAAQLVVAAGGVAERVQRVQQRRAQEEEVAVPLRVARRHAHEVVHHHEGHNQLGAQRRRARRHRPQ